MKWTGEHKTNIMYVAHTQNCVFHFTYPQMGHCFQEQQNMLLYCYDGQVLVILYLFCFILFCLVGVMGESVIFSSRQQNDWPIVK